jgi:hypothetical protein
MDNEHYAWYSRIDYRRGERRLGAPQQSVPLWTGPGIGKSWGQIPQDLYLTWLLQPISLVKSSRHFVYTTDVLLPKLRIMTLLIASIAHYGRWANHQTDKSTIKPEKE